MINNDLIFNIKKTKDGINVTSRDIKKGAVMTSVEFIEYLFNLARGRQRNFIVTSGIVDGNVICKQKTIILRGLDLDGVIMGNDETVPSVDIVDELLSNKKNIVKIRP